MNNYHNPRGSLWNRWDLHFHTPASYDYQNKGLTDRQIVDHLVANGIRVVAITDHHRMDVARIRSLQTEGAGRLTVLPGIELRSELGGSESVHYIGIFSETSDVADLWTKLSGKLDITEAEVAKRGDETIYCPFVKTTQIIRDLGGIVTVHAGRKTNTIEGLKNSDYIKQIVKKDLVRDCIDIYEVGSAEDCDGYVKNVFPHLDRRIPLILCSDSHDAAKYSPKAPLWLRADPTFRGLLMVLREPQGRVHIGERPEELIRVGQSPTKYIKSIQFIRKDSAPTGERWFADASITLNPGLVTIVGNKGSGKSALADTLGLLGGSRNDTFSFLNDTRFRRGGLAQHFSATMHWEAGDPVTRALSEKRQSAEVERVKYLPQDHVEKVCNELAGSGEAGFECELKGVIFSHVPQSERLGQTSLDDLVRFQTEEKKKRIDALVRRLKEESRSRALLEAQASPERKRELEEKEERRKLEIDAHDAAKPVEKPNPSAQSGGEPVSGELLNELTAAEAEKKAVEAEIQKANDVAKREERRGAVARRLLERIENFQKEFGIFRTSLTADANELGIDPEALVSVAVHSEDIQAVLKDAGAALAAAKALMEPTVLPAKIDKAELRLRAVQTKLDEPNRAYQTYLKDLSEWQERRDKLEGSVDSPDPESLLGLRAAISTLRDLPSKIEEARAVQAQIAREIHQEKLAQAGVYRTLYRPVQEFIDGHALAREKLRLEFRAELASEGFAQHLLRMLALNRRGSFMGVDEGRAKVDELVRGTDWNDPESVQMFARAIDGALHFDQRLEALPSVQVADQLSKGSKVEEVFDLLYGLEYVQPRYVLRWDGKDIAMLSAGERGTLLLVFYLLIDTSDTPLVIDQPEGNLDNQTITKVLVECLKAARKRRQVFIVTHNPNLAVVCDADQVIHVSIDKTNGNLITYTSGSLENPDISKHVTNVLEGTREAFGLRDRKYKVGD